MSPTTCTCICIDIDIYLANNGNTISLQTVATIMTKRNADQNTFNTVFDMLKANSVTKDGMNFVFPKAMKFRERIMFVLSAAVIMLPVLSDGGAGTSGN